MRHAFVRRAAIALAIAGVAAACGRDSTAPKTVPEFRSYVLTGVDDGPLPYYRQATTAGDTVAVLAETLALRTDGTATRSSIVRTVVAGGSATTGTATAEYSYQVSGAQLTLVPKCPPGALCVRGETGTMTASGLTLQQIDSPGAPVLRYTLMMPD